MNSRHGTKKRLKKQIQSYLNLIQLIHITDMYTYPLLILRNCQTMYMYEQWVSIVTCVNTHSSKLWEFLYFYRSGDNFTSNRDLQDIGPQNSEFSDLLNRGLMQGPECTCQCTPQVPHITYIHITHISRDSYHSTLLTSLCIIACTCNLIEIP